MAAEPPPCKKPRLEATTNHLKQMCGVIWKFEMNMLEEVKAARRKCMEIHDPAKDRSENEALMEPVRKAYVEEMGKRAKAMREELKPVIEQAFKEHDVKKTNVLDKEEATAFWDHLMDEQGAFAHDLWNMRVKNKIEMDYTMRGIYPITLEQDLARMDKGNEELVQKMLSDYKANKVERDAAAFKVVDINGDGTLQLSELVEALTPGSENHTKLMQALGLLDFDPNSAGRGRSNNFPGTAPVEEGVTNQITIMWQKGMTIWDDGYKPLMISLDWKVRDLIDKTGGMPIRSMYPGGKPRGVIQLTIDSLKGSYTRLDLEVPANLEKPLSALNLCPGCQVGLIYGDR